MALGAAIKPRHRQQLEPGGTVNLAQFAGLARAFQGIHRSSPSGMPRVAVPLKAPEEASYKERD